MSMVEVAKDLGVMYYWFAKRYFTTLPLLKEVAVENSVQLISSRDAAVGCDTLDSEWKYSRYSIKSVRKALFGEWRHENKKWGILISSDGQKAVFESRVRKKPENERGNQFLEENGRVMEWIPVFPTVSPWELVSEQPIQVVNGRVCLWGRFTLEYLSTRQAIWSIVKNSKNNSNKITAAVPTPARSWSAASSSSSSSSILKNGKAQVTQPSSGTIPAAVRDYSFIPGHEGKTFVVWTRPGFFNYDSYRHELRRDQRWHERKLLLLAWNAGLEKFPQCDKGLMSLPLDCVKEIIRYVY